jgi:Undecaprenyl-phosphate glucose phosphotransferase
VLKRHERFFSQIQKLIDIVIISFSWGLAYYIRFHLLKSSDPNTFFTFLNILPVIIIISIYFFKRNGLYQSYRFSSRHKEIITIVKSNIQSILLLVILLYFLSPERLSRLTLVTFLFIQTFLSVATRLSIRNFLRIVRRNRKNLRHILLIGDSEQIVQYVEKIRSHKDAGINILGWIDSDNQAEKLNYKNIDLEAKKAIEKYHPDQIVIGYSRAKSHKIEDILLLANNYLIPIQILPDLTFSIIGHRIENFAGIPLLSFNQPKLETIDYVLKRIFDVILSLLGLLILSPLFFFIGLVVKLSSPGPIIYGQKRMGLDGKEFTMWKFRTMRVSIENTPGWTTENDPRRTRFGSFLRGTSLDELPQLVNVLIGDMSLVGPRPEQTYYVGQFREKIPAYMLRHKVKAGITGWAQINGWRGDTSISKRLECDIYYIKNWSLWLDIKIVFLTLCKGLMNKNAY